MTNVAITIIGNDRPGLVSALAFGRLAGQFAGVVLVDLPDERYDDFEVARCTTPAPASVIGQFHDREPHRSKSRPY